MTHGVGSHVWKEEGSEGGQEGKEKKKGWKGERKAGVREGGTKGGEWEGPSWSFWPGFNSTTCRGGRTQAARCPRPWPSEPGDAQGLWSHFRAGQGGREEPATAPLWGWRVGRDKGAESAEVERGGGGLLSNRGRFREVAGAFLPLPLREDFFFFF